MNLLKSITIISILSLFITSCSSSDDPILEPVVSLKVENLYAPQSGGQGQPISGEFTKFSFSTGTEVTSDNWDIAFRGTTIIVNGGEVIGLTDEPIRTGNASLAIETGTMASVSTAPADVNFAQDADATYALPTGSDNGWYTYLGPPSHAINPIAGKIIVVKTIEGNYAKMEILSYYKDSPTTIEVSTPSKYYTFNYVYNPNKGEKSFE